MALVVADRVRETSTTDGTGTYTLLGAVLGHQAFSEVGDGNTTYYCATNGTDWEVGTGTYTLSGTTLARTTVHASSNSGSAVDWPTTGTRNIYGYLPATILDSLLSGGGSFSGPGSSTDNAVVRFDGTGGSTGQNSAVQIDDNGVIILVDQSADYGSPGAGFHALWVSDGTDSGFNMDLMFKNDANQVINLMHHGDVDDSFIGATGGAYPNTATAIYAGVAAGRENDATAEAAFVGGGRLNVAGAANVAIVGGQSNVQSSGTDRKSTRLNSSHIEESRIAGSG